MRRTGFYSRCRKCPRFCVFQTRGYGQRLGSGAGRGCRFLRCGQGSHRRSHFVLVALLRNPESCASRWCEDLISCSSSNASSARGEYISSAAMPPAVAVQTLSIPKLLTTNRDTLSSARPAPRQSLVERNCRKTDAADESARTWEKACFSSERWAKQPQVDGYDMKERNVDYDVATETRSRRWVKGSSGAGGLQMGARDCCFPRNSRAV